MAYETGRSIDRLIELVPYEKIRLKAMKSLNEKLKGEPQDIELIVNEMKLIFKKHFMKSIYQSVIRLVSRDIDKNMTVGLGDWYEAQIFKDAVMCDIHDFDLGDAATS